MASVVPEVNAASPNTGSTAERRVTDTRSQQPRPAAAASTKPASGGPTLRLSDGTFVLVADLALTQRLAFALLHPGTTSEICKNVPCFHGADCIFLHRKGQASETPAPGGPMLQLKDGTSVLVADLAPTRGLAFALMNPGKAQMCNTIPCPHGVECSLLHSKQQPAPGNVVLQLQDGTSVLITDLAPTQGLALALMNQSKAQVMCTNAPSCPHGRDCIFLHRKEQMFTNPAPGPAMLQLSDGSSVAVADLARTQGLAFALANPGQSYMCKNPACVDGVACSCLHLRSTSNPPHSRDRNELERARGALWTLWCEVVRQLEERTPSDALAKELINISRDVRGWISSVDLELAAGASTRTNTVTRAPNIVDHEKKLQ